MDYNRSQLILQTDRQTDRQTDNKSFLHFPQQSFYVKSSSSSTTAGTALRANSCCDTNCGGEASSMSTETGSKETGDSLLFSSSSYSGLEEGVASGVMTTGATLTGSGCAFGAIDGKSSPSGTSRDRAKRAYWPEKKRKKNFYSETKSGNSFFEIFPNFLILQKISIKPNRPHKYG
jgi:hypothetical protein